MHRRLVTSVFLAFIMGTIISIIEAFIVTGPNPTEGITAGADVINISIGNARLYYNPGKNESIRLRVFNTRGGLYGDLWAHGASGSPRFCEKKAKQEVCLEWERDRRLRITWSQHTHPNVSCFDIEWSALECPTQVLLDCYDLGTAHWYGGYEDRFQPWPLNAAVRPESAYVTMDSYINQIGGVQERYFFNSNGSGIFIPEQIPLYVRINDSHDGRLCLIAKHENSPYHFLDGQLPNLTYHICSSINALDVHMKMSDLFIPKAQDIPDLTLFRYPIWSTWAQYHADINQSTLISFAQDILKYNFSHSQLEIDDNWTPHYGDMDFDTSKFPNASAMISALNKLGFRITIWVHPFFNIDSSTFVESSRQFFLIREYGSMLPALVSWWRGDAAGILDTTNPKAVEWFLSKLQHLKTTYNISSFKFDAGEVRWLPQIYNASVTPVNPNIYTKEWVSLAHRSDPDVRHQEVRVGYRTQGVPIFVRMLDKDSNWDMNNGLKTLIPSALTFGILGYPFILPDMIGGNAYDGNPDPELFVRWLQVTAFMPSLQFSVAPWIYNDTVIEISQKFIKLHEQYADMIILLARESVRSGKPIIRPLWWIDPEDEMALTCDSEFLLGNDVLVAPVLDRGARSRDVYLPNGIWRDELRQVKVNGKQWLKNYRADINELPYFTRLHDN